MSRSRHAQVSSDATGGTLRKCSDHILASVEHAPNFASVRAPFRLDGTFADHDANERERERERLCVLGHSAPDS